MRPPWLCPVAGGTRKTAAPARWHTFEGPELAHPALKAWLRRPDTQPATLLQMAKDFPKAEPALRLALEMLL